MKGLYQITELSYRYSSKIKILILLGRSPVERFCICARKA